ncbi:MAG: HAMP domain-containing histidine kinase [Patescibacteria group bacterium]|nr:HAMP domain-containing histidine kinase [Patescibacteria group bacterium]
MFHSARLKLTAWYLLIIMLVSLSFSLAIFRIATSELDRVERIARLRAESGFLPRPSISSSPLNPGESLRLVFLDPDLIAETKNRLGLILILINLGILGTSAVAGYFLAGLTLKPIAEMVEEQSRFVTDASHELRTPLTSLKSEIEVGLRDQNITLAEAKDILQSNLEEVNSLQTLSDALIKLTQYRAVSNNLDVTDVSLKNLAESAIKKVEGLAKSKNITLNNKVGDLNLEGHLPSLTELMVILLDNAIKYSPEGKTVFLSSEKNDGWVYLSISDEGPGIDEKDLPHVFDRFYRADKSRTKSDTPGYGLGLSIARQIVENHHGSIKALSLPGRGAAFTVQLPLKHNPKTSGFSKPIFS